MKDKDFDDIGKRLYDLEAEPPKNGWRKIGSALNTSGSPGKVVWLRKNWWKPLIILIPVGLYFLYSGQKLDNVSKSSLIIDSSVEKSGDLENDQTSTNAGSSEEKNDNIKADVITDDDASNSPSGHTAQNKPTAANEDTNDSLAKASAQQQGISASINSSAEAIKKTEIQENAEMKYNPMDRQAKNEVAIPRNLIPVSENSDVAIGNEIVEVESQVYPEDKIPSAKGNIGLDDSSNNEAALRLSDVVDGNDREQVPPSLTHEPHGKNLNAIIETAYTEKTAVATLQAKAIEIDSVASTVDEENQESERDGKKWRLTFSLSPQYVSKTVQPIANDDVLVTSVNRSRDNYKIGFSFAAGAGFSVTKNFYIDTQVSYAEVHQNIFFNYATGNIDTLIAVQQPDQSVRVTPVYQMANRQISSKYGYAGMRLGATHYFWSTARRRFSISAMAGAHYLVSADIKEKKNGNWVALSSDDLNKLNYSVMMSAGYNIILNRGWELMINPSLTYYLRKVKSSELPYNLTQQSLGLNFMFSKTLGSK